MGNYLDQNIVCEEATCQLKTRDAGVYARRCMMPNCSGVMNMEVPDRQLYTQMQYFEKLFDTFSLIKSHPNDADEIQAVLKESHAEIEELSRVVARILDTNSRRWVNMEQLFSF